MHSPQSLLLCSFRTPAQANVREVRQREPQLAPTEVSAETARMDEGKMHADEVVTSASLVGQLMEQFPQWAHLPITPVLSAGTDNALYRLGSDMVARLPRIEDAASKVQNEHRCLPKLAPQLPLSIPTPLEVGVPAHGYPWAWSVYRWIEGENATLDSLTDPREAAADLGRFVAALQRIDTTGGPAPGEHNSWRGESLTLRDEGTRDAIDSLRGVIDTDAATDAWEEAMLAPAWKGSPVWLHGDLQAGNLLATDGRLSAVIDFGCVGVGDPACDVMAAWMYLTSGTRGAFREQLSLDEATWARGRGWALSVGVVALPYYETTNPFLADIARRAIDEVLSDGRAT